MGGIIACLCCYCCLTTLKPRCIEIMALICNISEIAFLIYAIAGIPWDDIKNGGKIVFYITCALAVISLIILIILMCLRCGNKINTTKNSAGKCLCITEIVIDIVAGILIIIAEVIILSNMYDKDGWDDDYYRRRRGRYDSVFSDSEWVCVYVSLTGFEFALAIHFYCVSFLIKLISAKTDLSYLKYLETKEENSYVARTMNVFTNPPNQNNNSQLNFLGYDQNGHPIYAGNAQYMTVNQPTQNVVVKGK